MSGQGGERLTVLVTGASGVVGRAVVEQLRGHRVIGTVHSESDVPGLEVELRGDLGAPLLGLGAASWEQLVDEVDVVVHSAALTQWGQPKARYDEMNVEGTRKVVELAQRAGAPVHYVGTCFVHALERDDLHLVGDDNVVLPYITSKLAAEKLLAASGVPYSIFRPTNLVGDSGTGASHRPQIVQMLSEWIARGKAPFFPLHAGNLLDFAPLDVLAKAVAGAVRTGTADGSLYWVTYGDRAMDASAALRILSEFVRDQGRQLSEVPIVDPRDPLPVPLSEIQPLSRAFLEVLIDVSEVTSACGGVLPTSLPELHRRFGVPEVSDTDAYRRSLDHWAAERAAPQSQEVS